MNVCPPAEPATRPRTTAGNGRVATISEYTGTTERGASAGAPRLGRAHDSAGAHRAAVRDDLAAVRSSAPWWPRRSARRAARRPARARAPAGRAAPGRSRAVTSRPSTLVAPTSADASAGPSSATRPAGVGRLCAGPGELRGRAGERDGAALHPVAGDALVRDRPSRPRRPRRASPPASRRRGRAVPAGQRGRRRAGNSAEHQPPLRPLAPNPATSRSTTSTRRPGRPAAGVRRPEAGVAGADDADVGLGVAVQRRARREVVAVGGDLLVPERERTQSRAHASVSTPRRICSISSNSAWPGDQRRRELDDRVAAVVGAAVQPGLEQRLGQEPAQQPLALLVVERLLGGLVLDQLDAEEEALAAHVADDRQVEQLLQRRPERRGLLAARAR